MGSLDQSLTKQLRVFVPTSPAPWNPSTGIIKQVVEGIWRLMQEQVEVWIYCDGAAAWVSRQEQANYSIYCDRLESLHVGPIRVSQYQRGLVGLVKWFMEDLDRPVLVNVQHDWQLLNPERVDSSRLVHTIYKHRSVQVVRLHKRVLPQRSGYVDRQYFEVDEALYGVPLIGTDGWGDSPQFAHRDHYYKFVLPNVVDDVKRDGGRYGLEAPVWRSYRQDVRRMGFQRAQQYWGSFIYGRFGDEAYVRHLGGTAKRWRAGKQQRSKGSTV